MNKTQVYVGLDYHSKSIQVCVMDAQQRLLLNRKCPNSVSAVARLVDPFGPPAAAAVEACCGAADFAEALITQEGWSVTLAHPGYVARMKTNPDKTDYSDARMLADLCRVGMIPRVWLAPRLIRELRLLVRYRFDQVRRRTSVKFRIGAILREQRISTPPMKRWSKGWIAWLRQESVISPQGRWIIEQHLREIEGADRQIRDIEAQLAAATADDPIVAHLLTIDGIGVVTAWTMRALIGRFDRFANGKQLARFCALTPRNASSGQRQADAGLIKAGDPSLKCVLIQAAHRLRRHHPRWRTLYDRLRARGKRTTVATAAVANRWVRTLHHEMTRRTPCREEESMRREVKTA